jgi:hypothetical protein
MQPLHAAPLHTCPTQLLPPLNTSSGRTTQRPFASGWPSGHRASSRKFSDTLRRKIVRPLSPEQIAVFQEFGIDSSGPVVDGGTAADASKATPAKIRAQAGRTFLDRRLIVRRASEVEPEAIQWLWQGRLARGKHTCFAGEPGTGKSQLLIHMVAAVTTGGYWPCDEGRSPIGSAVILCAEDGEADTIIPRLMAAGADRSRVSTVSAVRLEAGRRNVNLQTDLELLERKIREMGDVALIVIDPISSYLGKVDSHKNAELRTVLEPVGQLAESTRSAIASVTHFSKGSAGPGGKALHRFIGSIAFVGAPRAAFAVMEDPEDGNRRLVLCAKNNLVAMPQGLAFRLAQTIVADNIVASHVVFESQPVSQTADQVLAAGNASPEDRSAKADCMDMLRELLADGPHPAKETETQCAAAGYTPKVVRTARKALQINVHREGFGRGSKVLWSLPAAAPDPHRCPPEA